MPRTPLPSSAKDYTPAGLDRKNIVDVRSEPDTELARYRILSPKAGVRVSPLSLGSMSLGDQWTGWMGGKLSPNESEKLLDAFYEAGGNFIDSANNYQDEQSEMIIGEWMEKRGVRDEIVLATKYTAYSMYRKEGRQKGVGVNYMGNHVSDSLKKLRTSYIDILYVHWWDYTTSVEEVMLGLNDLVREC
ncbi:oxidoreductase with NAD+ or NADP+ as acceptor [Saitozyma sp. JCM 24511]|nr:oxidoreductase with NAD+ or NADP+ as acceptor [Saitozyma sp. JCM 24511]